MTPCVLITEKEYGKGQQIFDAAADLDIRPAPADEAALARAVRDHGATAVVVGVERYDGALYAALAESAGDGGAALIARFGVGCDGIDLAAADAAGIVVTNTPGVLDRSVAEHAIWLMGALARRVTAGDAVMRDGGFAAGAGRELSGKTLAILGFGPIGQRVARIAHWGLEMAVRAVDLAPMEQLARRAGRDAAALQRETGVATTESDADAVIGDADVVSLHLPALPATRHFIDAGRLARFRSGALLVNTARGALIDEVALYDALAAGRLAAALDVFEQEPYRPQAPGKDLRTLDNVVLTPHVGSATREANCRMAEACVANAKAFVDGRLDQLTRVPPPPPHGAHRPRKSRPATPRTRCPETK